MPPLEKNLSPETKKAIRQQVGIINKRVADAQEAIKQFEKAKAEAQRAIDRINAEIILYERAKVDLSNDLGEPV
jgi:regulator of protease activity HflC (stomatin/prohibitin superfamily)